jgi:hypothetical protein
MADGWYRIDFARSRHTNPARIPIGVNADWYYTRSGSLHQPPDASTLLLKDGVDAVGFIAQAAATPTRVKRRPDRGMMT